MTEQMIGWECYFIDGIEYLNNEFKSGHINEQHREKYVDILLDGSKVFRENIKLKKSVNNDFYQLIITELAEATINQLPDAILIEDAPPLFVNYVADLINECGEVMGENSAVIDFLDRPEQVRANDIVNEYTALVYHYTPHLIHPEIITKTINYVTAALIRLTEKNKPINGPLVKTTMFRLIERNLIYLIKNIK